MKITRVTVWLAKLKSHIVYSMADGKECAEVESAVIRIETSDGIEGWGEACPIPHYLPAYARGVAPALEEMAPVILGADPVGPEAVTLKAERFLPGHLYARSALDIALWDITGKAAGMPLYRLLGGRKSERMPLYQSITCVEPDEMGRIAKEAKAQGVPHFQAKLGASGNWQTDVERLAKVREAAGPEALVYGDWNCGASSLEATRVANAAKSLDVMLEQPCETMEECARVRSATGLPMKLDESVHDMATLLRGYRKGCMDAAALKLSKFGGISAVRAARDLCLHLGIKMCIEDTWGSDIATAAALHLAASAPPSMLLNTCDLSGYVSPRLDPSGPERRDGHVKPPEGPGLGVSPDLDILGKPLAILE